VRTSRVAVYLDKRDARHVRLVDIRVEDLVHKANTGALVRVLLRQLDMNLPYTAFIGRYNRVERIGQRQRRRSSQDKEAELELSNKRNVTHSLWDHETTHGTRAHYRPRA
jgi:hypothetical protein